MSSYDDTISEPPPSYEAISGPSNALPATSHERCASSSPSSHDDMELDLRPELMHTLSTSEASSARRVGSRYAQGVPCVVPQLTGGRNSFMTPFLRAYAPELANHGISEADLVAFIDRLNEAFLGSPVFQGTNVVGMVLPQSYGLSSVQLAGGIVELASGVGCAAVSYGWTRAYLKVFNDGLFNPAGLHVNIVSTEKMLEHVEFPEQEMPSTSTGFDRTATIPVVSAENVLTSSASSRPDSMIERRMQVLEGYCLPLNYDVPESVKPDNLLKRMGNAQAARLTQKHEKKMGKEREKAGKRDEKSAKKIEKARRKGDSRIEGAGIAEEALRRDFDRKVQKIEGKVSQEQEKLERKLTAPKIVGDPKEQRKVQKDYDKEMTSLQEDIDKERKKFEKEKAKLDKDGEKEGRKRRQAWRVARARRQS